MGGLHVGKDDDGDHRDHGCDHENDRGYARDHGNVHGCVSDCGRAHDCVRDHENDLLSLYQCLLRDGDGFLGRDQPLLQTQEPVRDICTSDSS